MDISQHHPLDRERAYEAMLRDAFVKPFQWGTHDCVAFPAAAMKARTGRNELGDLKWDDAESAMRLLDSLGGLRAELTKRFGEPIGILQACTGDLVLVRDDKGRELLALRHHDVVLAPAATGLAYIPLSDVICAWRVPA